MSCGDFDKPLTVYEIKGTLMNITPLAVGSGRNSPMGTLDNPIVRDESGLPLIPGSTLKGVLRSEAERYARSLGERVCDILDPKGDEGELTWQERKGEDECEPCVICRIFGGPTIASHVTFMDARLSGRPPEKVSETRTRVAINRVTGGHHHEKLFDIEYVVPGHEFSFKMRVEGINLEEDCVRARILRYILRLLSEGRIQVGGGRSIGFGFVKLKIADIVKEEFKDGEISTSSVKELIPKIVGGGKC